MSFEKIKSFIGGLVGGFIATIPWILMYVYGGFILSLLGFVIGYGAFYGYKLLGGKVNKNTYKLVLFFTFISITVSTFVIIPLLMLWKEGYNYSLDNLLILYQMDDFLASIIGDFIISLLFALMGATSTNKIINKNIENVDEKLIDTSSMTFEEKYKLLEGIFDKYKAFSKESMVSDSLIIKDLNVLNKMQFLTEMEREGVTTGTLGKSYFNKDYFENPEKHKKTNKNKVLKMLFIIIGVCSVLLIALTIIPSNDNDSDNYENDKEIILNNYYHKDLSIKLPNTFVEDKENDEAPDVEYIIYINENYDSSIYDILLQKVDISDYSSFDEWVEYYKNNLSNSSEFIKQEDGLIDNLDYKKIIFHNKNDKTVYYWDYVIHKDNSVYLLSFIVLSEDEEIKEEEFEKNDIELDSYFNTVRFNKDTKIH